MTTIARKIIATPARSAVKAWEKIIKILAPDEDSFAEQELLAINGIACSLIADEAMKTAPIIIYGCGPRVRIYCLYNEEAITGDDAKEDALSFNATEGDWHVSLPCSADDLDWIQTSLKKISERITVRDMTASLDAGTNESDTKSKAIEVDKEAFFRP